MEKKKIWKAKLEKQKSGTSSSWVVIMVDLGGYVIILVETNDKRVKLYGDCN